MKIKKVALLCASALLLAGGVSTAIAVSHTAAEQSYNGKTDSAVILKWGTNQVENVTSLTPTAYVYRCVVLQNPSTSVSSGVTGNVTLTFTLAEAESSVLTNVSVNIYQGKTVAEVEADGMSGGQKKTHTLTPTAVVSAESAQTKTAVINVPVSTAADVSFVLEFNLSEDVANATIGGSLSVEMDYAPAQA